MIEPVTMDRFLLFFFTAALVVLAALGYAVLYAFARICRKRVLRGWAGLAYGVLAGAVLALARLAHLEGFWQALTVLLLIGYGVAPVLIWRLCVATHEEGGKWTRHRGGHLPASGKRPLSG